MGTIKPSITRMKPNMTMIKPSITRIRPGDFRPFTSPKFFPIRLGLLLLALWLVAPGAGPASAHALLVRSIPEANAELAAAPATLEMWFGEPLEAGFTRVRLLTPLGEELPVGSITLDPADTMHVSVALEPLPPGIYTVAYQNLSQADGHIWNGVFSFTILNPDGSRPAAAIAMAAGEAQETLPTPAETVVRWVALLAALLFWGAPFFQSWVVLAVAPPETAALARTLVLRTVGLAAAMLILMGGLQLALQALSLGSLSHMSGLLATRTGSLTLARQGLALVGLFIALARPPYPWTALLMLGAPLLLTFSIGSHASAAPGSGWAVLGDYLHLLAAATWLGGLILIPLFIRRLPATLPLLRRFSLAAGLSVFGLLVTGLFSSLVELPSLASLWTTLYGQVLLFKVALVALALVAAFFNYRFVQRQSSEVSETSLEAHFRPQLIMEIVLALGVMLAVAILVQTTPSRAVVAALEAARPVRFEQVTQVDDLNVHVQVYPTQVGRNSFWVHLYHDDHSFIGEVQLVRLFFNHQDEALGQATTDLENSSPDIFTTAGTYLTQGGPWDLSVYVRRRGVDDVMAEMTVAVPFPAGSAAGTNAWQNPAPHLPPAVMIAGVVVTLGTLPLVWRWLRRG
jgi:copper transport protein